MNVAGGKTSLLNGDRGEDDLKVVLDAMLHFTKQ
jgi:hypothetical protein